MLHRIADLVLMTQKLMLKWSSWRPSHKYILKSYSYNIIKFNPKFLASKECAKSVKIVLCIKFHGLFLDLPLRASDVKELVQDGALLSFLIWFLHTWNNIEESQMGLLRLILVSEYKSSTTAKWCLKWKDTSSFEIT